MSVNLTTYITRTQLQLQNPSSAAAKLFTTTDLTTYINLARSQLCGEAECVHVPATVPVVALSRSFAFSAITGLPSGAAGVLNVRQMMVEIGTGQGGQGYAWMQPRSFPWFVRYYLNQVVPPTGLPTTWCQVGQGVTGTIYLDPVLDQDYTLWTDTILYPVDLVDDTTPEIIPYPWTDVVPFYAAWYALTSANRQTDADKMMERVTMYMGKARGMSNPDVVPNSYMKPQGDPSKANRFGIKQGRQSG